MGGRRRLAGIIIAAIVCQTAYADKSLGFQQEKMSPMKTAGYTVLGLGTIVGIVAVADSIESDSSGTKVVIGDGDDEDKPEPALLTADRGVPKGRSRDMERTTLYLEDISTVFREAGRRSMESDGVEVFLEGIDRRDEYEGFTGGVYYSRELMTYRGVDIRGGLAYGHTEVEYEKGSEGSAETLHGAIYMDYAGERIESYSWISGEYGYNRYEEGETARYSSRRAAAGSENSVPLYLGNTVVKPLIYTEVSYMRRGDIDLKSEGAPGESYTSIKWGPGVEVKNETRWRRYRIETTVRGICRFEEGNIYDKGVAEEIAPDRTTEVSLEVRGEGEEVYLFIGGGYYIQSGADYYRGGLGAGFRL